MTWSLLSVVVCATVLADLLQSHEMKRAGEQDVSTRGLGRLLRMIAHRAPLGLATVFLGKGFDFVANRIADALLTLPSIFFVVAVTAALGNGIVQAMFPVGILLIPAFFRITRSAAIAPSQRARSPVGRGVVGRPSMPSAASSAASSRATTSISLLRSRIR